MDGFPLQVGDTGTIAQISPCVGGLVRTWVDGGESKLWSTPDADWLFENQATGTIGRTMREEHRFREAAFLSDDGRKLLVLPRFPLETDEESLKFAGQVLRLEAPKAPTGTVFDNFYALLGRAVQHCVTGSEFLVVERGGWEAPDEPYCLFILTLEDGSPISIVETAPPPRGSQFWEPHIREGEAGATVRAPAATDTIDVVPALMIEAITRWGLDPWDLALTFGRR